MIKLTSLQTRSKSRYYGTEKMHPEVLLWEKGGGAFLRFFAGNT